VKFDSSASLERYGFGQYTSRRAVAVKTMIASAWAALSPDEALPDRREASDGTSDPA